MAQSSMTQRFEGGALAGGTSASTRAVPTAPASLARFLARATAVLGIAVLCATALFASRPGWGWLTVACFAWSAASALGLGWVGFHNMSRALTCPPTRMPAIMLLGFLLRGFLLVVSQLAAYALVGPEWGHRLLIATTVFYLFVLGVEVHTLNRLFQSSQAATQRRANRGEPGEGTERS